MSEKDKLSFHDGEEEEFHITDEDIDRELAAMEMDQSPQASADFSSEAAMEKTVVKKRFGALKQLKRKHWIIIIVILIILIFGLLKFVGGRQSQTSFGEITPAPVASNTSGLNTKKPTADLTKAVFESNTPATGSSSATSASLLPTPTLSAPASATAKTNVTAVTNNDPQLAQALEAIQQQNQLLTQQLTALSSRVVGLESTLTQSNQAVEGLSQQVGALKKTDASPATSLPHLAQSLPTGPQYTVEAVVPQRAWLQTADGSTMTVMIGDDLPGLGAVVSIDPYSGNVTTASGTVIKYGS